MSLCHPPPTCTQSYPLSGLGERESWNTTGESGADDKGVLIGRWIQQSRQGREDKSTERWVRERRRGLEREWERDNGTLRGREGEREVEEAVVC